MKKRIIPKITFQLLAPPQGRGNILILLDKDDGDFAEIFIDENDIRYLTIYPSSDAVCIPLDEIEKIVKTGKEKIKNILPDD